jgi:hypothetical protein
MRRQSLDREDYSFSQFQKGLQQSSDREDYSFSQFHESLQQSSDRKAYSFSHFQKSLRQDEENFSSSQFVLRSMKRFLDALPEGTGINLACATEKRVVEATRREANDLDALAMLVILLNSKFQGVQKVSPFSYCVVNLLISISLHCRPCSTQIQFPQFYTGSFIGCPMKHVGSTKSRELLLRRLHSLDGLPPPPPLRLVHHACADRPSPHPPPQ